MKFVKPKDAVILGLAARYPEVTQDLIKRLEPDLRSVGRNLVEGSAVSGKNGEFAEYLAKWAGGEVVSGTKKPLVSGSKEHAAKAPEKRKDAQHPKHKPAAKKAA